MMALDKQIGANRRDLRTDLREFFLTSSFSETHLCMDCGVDAMLMPMAASLHPCIGSRYRRQPMLSYCCLPVTPRAVHAVAMQPRVAGDSLFSTEKRSVHYADLVSSHSFTGVVIMSWPPMTQCSRPARQSPDYEQRCN
jgi:hypothetical protein